MTLCLHAGLKTMVLMGCTLGLTHVDSSLPAFVGSGVRLRLYVFKCHFGFDSAFISVLGVLSTVSCSPLLETRVRTSRLVCGCRVLCVLVAALLCSQIWDRHVHEWRLRRLQMCCKELLLLVLILESRSKELKVPRHWVDDVFQFCALKVKLGVFFQGLSYVGLICFVLGDMSAYYFRGEIGPT